MDNKAEEEEKQMEEEKRDAKRKRFEESDDEEESDPKGKGKSKGKEKKAIDSDDDFEEPKQKKIREDKNGSSSALPTSGFSMLTRSDLDMSKHYAHEETEIEESKVELMDEFMAPEVGHAEEYPWRVLTDFTIYDISDQNRCISVLLFEVRDLTSLST